MREIRAIQSEARSRLIGKYGLFSPFLILYFLCFLIATAIPSALFSGTDIPVFHIILRVVLSFMLLILVNLIRIGISRAAFCLCREIPFSYRDIFYAFGESRDQFLKVEMLLSAIQSVISLLIMALEYINEAYSLDVWEYYGLYILFTAITVFLNLAVTLRLTFAVYVIMEQPEIGALAALRASLALTKGKYFRLLLFRLSFAGMYLLGYASLLFGFLYVRPYIEVSVFLYYRELYRRRHNG